MFLKSSFNSLSVKGIYICGKVCQIIDGFNESHRQIAYGVKKMADSLTKQKCVM